MLLYVQVKNMKVLLKSYRKKQVLQVNNSSETSCFKSETKTIKNSIPACAHFNKYYICIYVMLIYHFRTNIVKYNENLQLVVPYSARMGLLTLTSRGKLFVTRRKKEVTPPCPTVRQVSPIKVLRLTNYSPIDV